MTTTQLDGTAMQGSAGSMEVFEPRSGEPCPFAAVGAWHDRCELAGDMCCPHVRAGANGNECGRD